MVSVNDDNDFVLPEGLELGSGQSSDLLVPDTVTDAETLFVTFVFQVVEVEQLEDVYVVKVCMITVATFIKLPLSAFYNYICVQLESRSDCAASCMIPHIYM